MFSFLFRKKKKVIFKCDVCDKAFVEQSKLNRQKFIHKEKSFQCKYCPKKYKAKQYLDYHQFEHTGGKLFKCDLCEKTFATQYLLKKLI